MRDQAELTTSVILNPQGYVSHGVVFHQGDGLVGAHLGHSEGGGLVVVHACMDMDWDPVMLAPSGAYLGLSPDKHQLRLGHGRRCR